MLYNVFVWFLNQRNIGLDPQIMILHEVISEILEISDFEAAILKNGRKIVVRVPEQNGTTHGGSWGVGGGEGEHGAPISSLILCVYVIPENKFQFYF